MESIGYDIETAPLPDAKFRITKWHPFKESEVKVGNLKDPEKIAAKIADAKANHVNSHLDRAQLDPSLSYVCAIGIINESGDVKIETGGGVHDEKKLLEWFWSEMKAHWTSGYFRWIGWNSNEFDIKFLFKRSWIQGVEPNHQLLKGRWMSDRLVDLMKVWTFHGYNEYASLERVADVLGVSDPKRPQVDGKDFYKVLKRNPELAERYLTADLKETMAIADKILSPYA